MTTEPPRYGNYRDSTAMKRQPVRKDGTPVWPVRADEIGLVAVVPVSQDEGGRG